MTTPLARRDFDRARATGADLRLALQSASTWLTANAERVNALNVFPVPDGDTGTNMSLTLQVAVESLAKLGESPAVSQVARTAYEAAMLGARGNSGVILSQLLSGFSRALANESELTPSALARALTQGAEVAYGAVSRPVEGTILTVAREAGSAATAAAAAGRDLPGLLEQTLSAANDAVAETPNQLEVLRKAGVVDSGGEGYRVILEGAWMWSTGRSMEQAASAQSQQYSQALLHDVDTDETAFGFCTEFLLRDTDVTVDEVKSHMESLGDSVLAVGDPDLLRVHVHTERPGQALEFAVDHGTLVKVKVENMQLQHEAFAAQNAATQAGGGDGDQHAASSIGVIAVAAGDGLLKVFRSLGARVVQGGQTMNPSVQEILAAVNSSGYKELIILPNNSNIILTAQHVQELTPHMVTVVPTETAPQGIGALLAFNFQADMQTNVSAMARAAHAVHTVEVTRAVRDAEVDDIKVMAGDMLGIYDGRVVATSSNAAEALLHAFAQAPAEALEIATIYFGADATEADAQAVAGQLRQAHPAVEIQVVEGGQPHYPFVVSLE
ncbi:MAG TPA: DAK2 domain-containing protein [Chloroflexota bacterium]|nr:DAK2 domain-containing protein [Chloroflexota bacterium]